VTFWACVLDLFEYWTAKDLGNHLSNEIVANGQVVFSLDTGSNIGVTEWAEYIFWGLCKF